MCEIHARFGKKKPISLHWIVDFCTQCSYQCIRFWNANVVILQNKIPKNDLRLLWYNSWLHRQIFAMKINDCPGLSVQRHSNSPSNTCVVCSFHTKKSPNVQIFCGLTNVFLLFFLQIITTTQSYCFVTACFPYKPSTSSSFSSFDSVPFKFILWTIFNPKKTQFTPYQVWLILRSKSITYQ